MADRAIDAAPPDGGRSYGGVSAADRREQRRDRLLAAGLEIFGTRGFADTTIEELCRVAGVSTRNFYDEFDGRDTLLIALYDQVDVRARSAVADVLATADDDSDLAVRVERALAVYFDEFTQDPRWARLAFVEAMAASTRTQQARRAAHARFAALIEAEATRLAAAGIIPVRDYALTATAVVGAIVALVETWSVEGRAPSRRRIVDEATRVILAVLAWPDQADRTI